MIPREPPRQPQIGFVYYPPFRVQGMSIAGEATVVQVPELDVCFDIGKCPRMALASPYVALSHGHMDHSAGLAYYFSQRQFQGMGVGTLICHPGLEEPIHNIMRAWVNLEGQQTPYKVVPLAPDGELEIKNNIFLRAIETIHTASSQGYVIIERRSKLRADLIGQPQEKLMELKKAGQAITRTIDIPLVCFTGDTMWGSHFDRPDLLGAKILITECTFVEPEHRDRAAVGRHLHLDNIIDLLDRSKAEAVILTHTSRRTNMSETRRFIDAKIPPEHRSRVHLLMDSRANRARYAQQLQTLDSVKST